MARPVFSKDDPYPLESSSSQPDEVAEPEAVYEWSPSSFAQPSAPPFLERLLRDLGQGLNDLADRYAAAGRNLEELGSPAALAERMVASLPSPSPWNQAVGPFYSASQITEIFGGVSRQAVADRRDRRTLLALRTRDGQWVYPVFQFGRDGQVVKGLSELLQILAPSGVDDWTLAGWLSSPLRSLGGTSPRAWLAEGRPLEPLLVVARDAARRFAQ
jgi:hypothetical protein